MKFSRREFIKISSIGVGGLVLAKPLFNFLSEETPLTDGESERFPTYCEVCFWKCAGWTYVKPDGELWKIIGNEKDTLSNGRFCPRGTGGIGMYNDTDRLKKPLKRVQNGDKQEFVEIEWDEAFTIIADELKRISTTYQPESIALFSHGSGGDYFGDLLKAMGSGNYAMPSYAQCRGPREVAFLNTFGTAINSPEPTDILNTRCLVLIGSHIGENMHNGQVQEMADAIDNGATIITVDPRFSTAASKSKYWLPIRPATDIALMLAWMNVIIEEELYDKNYVEKYSSGFELLKAHVSSKTPEWAYGITDIEPAIIRKTAQEMAAAAPAVIVHPGRHVTWYGDDVQRLRAVAILNALLGSWGRKGGFYFHEAFKLPTFPHPEFPTPKYTWKDAAPSKYPLAGTALANTLIDASIPSEERELNIKAWIVNGTNLISTIPNQKNTLKAIENLEFMVVIDTMPAEITGYADIVLPECTYLERYDFVRTSPHRTPSLALRMPATQPKYDSKPAWWMAKNIAEKLGLQEYFNYTDLEEVIKWQLEQKGFSLEELKKEGVINLERAGGSMYIAEGEEKVFSTPSGKIEFYSNGLAAAGFDAMPNYTPHPEPPASFYRLNYGRAPMHTFGRTTNNPNLSDLMEENSLWMNPKVAKIWNIENGQRIWLQNQDGVVSSFSIKVRITERIRWDSVYMVHGFGASDKRLQQSFGKGINDQELITNVMVDPIMGGTGMRGNFVTFLTQKPTEEVAS